MFIKYYNIDAALNANASISSLMFLQFVEMLNNVKMCSSVMLIIRIIVATQ